MKLTKYEHACFAVEKDGKTIIIDPGTFTSDLVIPNSVVAVIVTHDHGDHFNSDLLKAIIDKNPTAMIIGPSEVTAKLATFETKTVHGGDSFAVEGIDLDFYGGEHALIHPHIPLAENIGVLIDERVYFPGDSFTVPEKSVDVLALPVAAPWLKISETIEFMKTIGARLTFPTHDAILSTAGKSVVDSIVGSFANAAGTNYQRINGETIEIEQ